MVIPLSKAGIGYVWRKLLTQIGLLGRNLEIEGIAESEELNLESLSRVFMVPLRVRFAMVITKMKFLFDCQKLGMFHGISISCTKLMYG